MKLSLDITNAKGALGDFDSVGREALRARDTLLTRSGAGAAFTGWLELANAAERPELADIRSAAGKIGSESDVLVVIGIGGSYLGAQAALDYVKSPNYNRLEKDTPDIYFIGNGLSADTLWETVRLIGDRDFSVNVISKSGTTTEPAVAFRVFRELLEKKYGATEAAARIYATTDKSRGVLRQMAQAEQYTTFVIPDDVGGRYSVFTPVGLLPLAAAGVDIDEMLAGAAEVFALLRADDLGENLPAAYAAVRNALYRGGKTTEIFSSFEPALRYTGEWWKQLYGESEGKDGKGIFPASAVFTTDLHSMGQYIQDGLRNLMETFVKVETPLHAFPIPSDSADTDGLNFLSGRDVAWANHQALAATEAAHLDGGVPNVRVTVPDRSAASFGALAAFFEAACGVSGYMLGVNPFNQPGVEAYKINMFALLGKPGYEEERRKLLGRLESGKD